MAPRKKTKAPTAASDSELALTLGQKDLAITFIDDLELWVKQRNGYFPYAPYTKAMKAFLKAKKAAAIEQKAIDAEAARTQAEEDEKARIKAAKDKAAAEEKEREEAARKAAAEAAKTPSLSTLPMPNKGPSKLPKRRSGN